MARPTRASDRRPASGDRRAATGERATRACARARGSLEVRPSARSSPWRRRGGRFASFARRSIPPAARWRGARAAAPMAGSSARGSRRRAHGRPVGAFVSRKGLRPLLGAATEAAAVFAACAARLGGNTALMLAFRGNF